jgi:hypothetical protein
MTNTIHPPVETNVPSLAGNPLYQSFAAGQLIQYDGPLGFACRGCGHLCSGDYSHFSRGLDELRSLR